MITERDMPTYEYSCPACGSFEKEQRITDPKLTACPTCKAPVQRLISRTSFALKGSGWYSDGYSSSGSGKLESKSGSGASGGCGGACPNASACAGAGSPN